MNFFGIIGVPLGFLIPLIYGLVKPCALEYMAWLNLVHWVRIVFNIFSIFFSIAD